MSGPGTERMPPSTTITSTVADRCQPSSLRRNEAELRGREIAGDTGDRRRDDKCVEPHPEDRESRASGRGAHCRARRRAHGRTASCTSMRSAAASSPTRQASATIVEDRGLSRSSSVTAGNATSGL